MHSHTHSLTHFSLTPPPSTLTLSPLHPLQYSMSLPPPKPPKPPPKPPKPNKTNPPQHPQSPTLSHTHTTSIEGTSTSSSTSSSSSITEGITATANTESFDDSRASLDSRHSQSPGQTASRKASVKIDEALRESMQALTKTVFSGRYEGGMSE
jgi:type IV secretory pathway VirB10-like protein